MTLIELLVAVALLAIVASLAYRGLDNLARSSNALADDSQRWQDIALFFNRFGNDVAQPARRPIHIGAPRDAQASGANAAAGNQPNQRYQRFAAAYSAALGTMAQRADYSNAPSLPAWQGLPLATLDAADERSLAALEFTRKSATGRDEMRLGYRLRGTQVELLLWPILDRRVGDGVGTEAGPDMDPPDPDSYSRPAIHPLLDGVSALRFQHLDDSGAWLDHWPPQGAPDDMLPRAVAIELILLDGTRLRRIFALPA